MPYLAALWTTTYSTPTSCRGRSYALLNTWKELEMQLRAASNSVDVAPDEARGPLTITENEGQAWEAVSTRLLLEQSVHRILGIWALNKDLAEKMLMRVHRLRATTDHCAPQNIASL